MAPYIDLVMRPNGAIGRKQAWQVVAGVAVMMALGAVRFVLIGAWPVLVFSAIDLVLLGWALDASRRAAREQEEVRLDGEGLTIRHVSAGGRVAIERLEPLAARVEWEASRPPRLWLVARDRRVGVGGFLGAREKGEVRGVLEDGLARFRRGRP